MEPLLARGLLSYKCRLCGETYDNLSVPDVELAVIRIASGIALPESWGDTPRLIRAHYCGDGRYGVADLIGGREADRTDEGP